MKNDLKIEAIILRKQGLSYNDIKKKVKVSKSSLSLWLRNIPLSQSKKNQLKKQKIEAAIKGHKAWHEMRIAKTQKIIKEAKKDILLMKTSDELLLIIGTILYWAEGSKEKENKPGSGIIFSNSDARMIKIFILWLTKSLDVELDRIQTDIHLHENNRHRIEDVKNYWSKKIGLPVNKFDKIYFKRHIIKTKRKNISSQYNGLIRARVRKSADLYRKIVGWIEGICEKWGIV